MVRPNGGPRMTEQPCRYPGTRCSRPYLLIGTDTINSRPGRTGALQLLPRIAANMAAARRLQHLAAQLRPSPAAELTHDATTSHERMKIYQTRHPDAPFYHESPASSSGLTCGLPKLPPPTVSTSSQPHVV